MGVVLLEAGVTLEQVKDRTVVENTGVPEVDAKVKTGQKLDEPINFGLADTSNGVNGEAKEVNHGGSANFPKDVVDEWPAPKQIHSFYFVKYRSYDDQGLKGKLARADEDFTDTSEKRFQIIESLKEKRSERAEVISRLKPLTDEDKSFRMTLNDKRKKMEEDLGKLRDVNNAGAGLCSSVEELDDLIRSLNYRIQHESNTLVEEKKLLKQIKQLEGTRGKIIANQESLGDKEAIQDKVKLIFVDLDGVRRERQGVRNKIIPLEEELKALNNEINSLQDELSSFTEKREKAYKTRLQLRKGRDEINASYFQNRSLLNSARALAARKDIEALERLSHSEVDKFMSQWSSSKALRDDYEKRILASLDSRQLSRDGRMRNPDEKPILPEASAATESEAVPAQVTVKKAKEDLKSFPQHAGNHRDEEEDTTKSTGLELRGKEEGTTDTKNAAGVEKLQKETANSKEIDAAKLKEIKREEEIAKAKLALERKKKLAEKAASKAALKAQKEAEKKLKEKEKRAKRKAGASVPPPADQTENDLNIVEAEENEAILSTGAPAMEKNKEQKERVIKHRSRPQIKEQIPKIILKRKKSHSNWTWAAPAIVLVLVLIISGCYYFGKN